MPLHVDKAAAAKYQEAVKRPRTKWMAQVGGIRHKRRRFIDEMNKAIEAIEVQGIGDTRPSEKKALALYEKRIYALQQQEDVVLRAKQARSSLGAGPPFARDAEEVLSGKSWKIASRLVDVKAAFTWMDASSGEILTAFRYSKRSKTAREALAVIVEAIARNITATTRKVPATTATDVGAEE